MIDWATSGDPELREALERHTKVGAVGISENPGIDFLCGDWERTVRIGDPSIPLAGLVELIDNNPMVCADQFSVGDPVSTLALIGLGPLAWAGMILEPPTMISSSAGDADQVGRFLATAGWDQGITLHAEERTLGDVLAASCMAIIPTPKDWTEIDDLFEERYGRSFFVRRDEESDWDPKLVAGRSHAVYRLRYTPDEDRSLLTIQVLADRRGKCGGAQVLHAMNVMAGFEESLGID